MSQKQQDTRQQNQAGQNQAGQNHGGQNQGGQRNEGEGNKTAAREYNRETTEFTKSGMVDAKAREAERAFDGKEGDELRRAEQEGKRHAHGEDPEVRNQPRKAGK